MEDIISNIMSSKVDNWMSEMDRCNSTEIFCEVPVPLDDFLYSERFLNLPKLSPKQYEFVQHSTYIYHDKEIEQLNWLKIRRVGELVALWGKGGGKDWVSQITQARVAYLLLCLSCPQSYYGQAPITSIDMLNMAYNSDQAEQVFFKTFADLIDSCKWFSNKAEVGTNKVKFDKRIWAYSGNSFEEAFEGKNLIVAVLDEIAAFKTKMEVEQMSLRRLRAPRYSAESVFDMAKSSVESRFGNGIGKVISISFPRFKNDYIQQLYSIGKDEPTCYVSFGATWEVNPTKKKEDFADEFRKNPERAEARYACNPSSVEDGYFKNKVAILNAFPILRKEKVPSTDDRFPVLKSWFKCTHPHLCSIHIDLAKSRDKAGICVSHVFKNISEEKRDEQGVRTTIQKPVVAIDLQTSFIAPVNGEIDFSAIRLLVVDLVNRGFKIGKLTCDQFQCLTGDTRVECLDGNSYSLKELADKKVGELWVYAVDKDEIVPAKGFNIRKTGENAPVYKVTLDNGQVIRATEQHLFMLRDGTYRELRQLKPGDSLMPLYCKDARTHALKGYKQIYHPKGKWEVLHRLVMRKVAPYAFDSCYRKGFVIHHKNFKKHDNLPTNLIFMDKREHRLFHQKLQAKLRTGKTYEQQFGMEKAVVVKRNLSLGHIGQVSFKKGKTLEQIYPDSPEKVQYLKESCSKGGKKGGKVSGFKMATLFHKGRTYEQQYGDRYEEIRERHKKGIRESRLKQMQNEPYWQNHRRKLSLAHLGHKQTEQSLYRRKLTLFTNQINKIEELGLEVNMENYTKVRNHSQGIPGWTEYQKFHSAYLNHKIISIEFSGYEDVYDMEVDTFHNFALSSGVFVHNSTDFLQIMSKMGIETDTRSVDRNTDAYDCLKELIYDSRLCGYSYIRDIETPAGKVQTNEVIDELNNLILIGGKHVEHPSYGSKDIADALAGSVQGAIELGLETFTGNEVSMVGDREAVVASNLVADREYLSGLEDEYFSG